MLPGRSRRGALVPSRGFDFAKYRVAPRLGTAAVRRRLAGQMRRALLQVRLEDTTI